MIWIGTQDRVTIFNPQADVPDTMATTIQLRDILIFNEALDWVELQQNPDSMVILANGVVFKDFKFTNLSRWYSVPQEIQLSPDNNYLTLNFTANLLVLVASNSTEDYGCWPSPRSIAFAGSGRPYK
jgi:hypothetical protein